MRRLKTYVSIMLIISMLTGILPGNVTMAQNSEPQGDNLTNSSTVVDLEALKAIIDDDTDSNEDGLPDQLKRILGLDPELEDSNGDGISDKFKLDNGLDPLKQDTYDIGISDLYALTKGDEDISLNEYLLEEDLDEDGIFDIKDIDIDGDYVNNAVDLSVFSHREAKESHTLKIKTSGKTSELKLQIQPADIESLKRNSRIMTWPIDVDGQMSNFNASEDNVRIVPMLELDMAEYPEESVIEAWGYLLFQEQLYIPLQYIQTDFQPIALEATIHIPEEFGTYLDQENKYEIEMKVRLSWLMVGQTHNVTNKWEPFAKVQSLVEYKAPVMGPNLDMILEDREAWRDIKLEDFDEQNDQEYLGSDIADLNGNDIGDMAIYWVENNKVYEKIYYDLDFDDELYVYRAQSEEEIKYVYEFENETQERIESDLNSDLNRVHNAKYVVNLDNNRRNTAYYHVNSDDSLMVKTNVRTPGPKKEFTINSHGFYAENQIEELNVLWNNSTDPRKYSYIRDAAYKSFPDSNYPTNYGTVWYLYEMYNENTNNNEIVLMLDHSEEDSSNNIVQTEVLIDNLPKDSIERYERRNFRDLEKALSINVYDFDEDDKDDLMFSDRLGRIFIILDIYAGNGWVDRMYQISDNRSIEGVHGQNTQIYDFDGDGDDELVGIQAIRKDTSKGLPVSSTDLNFQISKKKNIGPSTEILMKDYEGFAITGMQLEEHQGIETKLITGEDTEGLLYMAAMFYNWYLQSDYSIEEVIDEYVAKVMDGDRSGLNEVSGHYGHLFEALLDIGQQIHENETWGNFSGPKPLLILTWEEDRYLNLDDLESNNFTREIVSIDISEEEIVTSKQLIVKWIENGETLSPEDIGNLVDENPEGLYEFEEDSDGNKEALAQLNIGVSEIIGIGDETIQAESFNAFKDSLEEWKSVWVVGKGTKYGVPVMAKMVNVKILPKMGITTFLPPNALLQPNNAVYKTKLAKYRAVTGNVTTLGKVVKGTGTLVDVGLAVYSGYLYGEAMAEIGGTAFGVVTGMTYGSMILASSLLTAQLIAAGPAGWAVLGVLLSDTIVSFFIEGYDGIVALSLSTVMSLLFDAKVYPGTKIDSIGKTDDEETNRKNYYNTNFGYTMGSKVEELSRYGIDLVAASYDTPANSSAGLDDSWVDLNVYNESNVVNTINDRSKTKDDTSKVDGYWHRFIEWDFNNSLIFNKPGINLPVDNRTKLYYRLIKSVKEQRYVVYTKSEVEYAKETIRSKSTDYYDVMPESLEMFWEYFNFINWDENFNHDFPEANNNEIAYRSPYYDSNNDGVPDRIKEELDLDISLTDSDGDGISDYDELKLGIDPAKVDSDGDGVSDNFEVNIPVEFTISTNNGSVTAWGYSDPLKVDTSGDGYNDDEKRSDGLNPASKHTQGSKLFDYNDYAPELIQEFLDLEVVDLDWIEFNLADYITDQDSDDNLSDLMFTVSHGEVQENDNGDFIWKYQFDMAEDGRYSELTLEANDKKGGILETTFLVYDESGPVIEEIRAGYDNGTSIAAINLDYFSKPLPSNPEFYTKFNKPIDFDNISGSAIKIEPIGDRGYLDTDNTLTPMTTSTAIELLDEVSFYEIGITREDPIVEDGIKYRLLIPGSSITDRDPETPYPMDKDYEISFFTEDNKPPKIKNIKYGLDGSGSTWNLNNPLVIEFNEEIVLADEQYYSLISDSDSYRRRFPLIDSNADLSAGDREFFGGGEGHLLMRQIDSRTVMVEIEPNYLESNKPYNLREAYNSNQYDVRDQAGNLFNSNYQEIYTGDVRGPAIVEDRNNQFRLDELDYNNYEVEIEANGEIRIRFNELIKPGELYDDIVLAYGNSMQLWMHEVMENEVKGSGLDHEKRIEDSTLIITPDVPFAQQADYMSYAVYIPSKSLTDNSGNTIFEESRYRDNNTHYESDFNDFTEVVRARTAYINTNGLYPVAIDHVAVPKEWGHRSVLEAMINFPHGEQNIVAPGKTLMMVLSERSSSLSMEDISLWKLDDAGSEVEIPHTPFFTPGSNVALLTPVVALEAETKYKVKFAESTLTVELLNGATVSFANPASESVFTVSNAVAETHFTGGNHLDHESFVGMTRVAEVIGVKGNISKYYDMFNNRFDRKENLLTYQWYRGDIKDAASAEPIIGANKILYVPQVEDEGKYLFLDLQVDYEGLDNYIPEELKFGKTVFNIMSPALGPIQPAFITSNELQNISVLANGEANQELLSNFDDNIMEYDISVSPDVTSVRVNPQFDEALNSYVNINGLPADFWKSLEEDGQLLDDGLDIFLDFGENLIYVTSIAENYMEDKTFTIKITRASQVEGDTKALPPEAGFVKIQNDKDFFIGKELTGKYKYYDELNRIEGDTTYQWYRHSENNAESRIAIPGATAINYLITEEDVGHYISFEVTPRAKDCNVLGTSELSWWIGPVGMITDKETAITNIEILYNGSNILKNYEPGKKVYPIDFASKDGSTVTVRVTEGDNVSINGEMLREKVVNFKNDTRVIEVVADSINPGEATSYFIVLNDEPVPFSIVIKGEEEVTLGLYDETVRWYGTVYDQYGEEIESEVEWDISTLPAHVDYRISGTNKNRLTIDIPKDSVSSTSTLEAWVKNDADILEEKILQITGDKEPITYTVTYDGNGHSTGTEPRDENIYAENETVTVLGVSDLEKEGFTFENWNTKADGSGNSYLENNTFNMGNSDMTLYAKWLENPTSGYIVKFASNGGSSIDSQIVTDGFAATRPDNPVKKGYEFINWYQDSELLQIYDFESEVTSNLTLYAKWEVITHKVSFMVIENNGMISAEVFSQEITSGDEVEEGKEIIFTATPAPDYQVKQWKINDRLIEDYTRNTYTINNLQNETMVTVTFEAIPVETYTVTFKDWDASSLKTEIVEKGKSATAPDEPSREGYTFTGWDKDFSNITSNLVVTAKYREDRTQRSGDGNNNDSSDTLQVLEFSDTVETIIDENEVKTTIRLKAESITDEKAFVKVTDQQIMNVVKEATNDAVLNDKSEISIEVNLDVTENLIFAQTSISKKALDMIIENNINQLTISNSLATITLDEAAISAIAEDTEGDIKINISKINNTNISETLRKKIGNRPLYEFKIEGGNRNISKVNGKITVTLPYNLMPDEEPEAIVIYYINNEEELEIVTNGIYHIETGKVKFTTNHFSYYMVGYNKVAFEDVLEEAWYNKAVSFIAARNITKGTGKRQYSPNKSILRGQLVVLLMRAYGIEPKEMAIDNFDDAGDTYYTKYLQTAKGLGIVEGIGNNNFAPEEESTREEIFTIVYKLLKAINQLPEGNSGIELSNYKDSGEVSSWAREAISLLLKSEIILGDDDERMNPTSTAKRSEIAQLLYNMLTK